MNLNRPNRNRESGRIESQVNIKSNHDKETNRRGVKRFIPLFIVFIFVILIARDRIPGIHDFFEKLLKPDEWQAQQACMQTALSTAESAGHARVINRGIIHKTQAGFFVEKMAIGHMTTDGTEGRFLFSCYTDQAGEVVKSHKFTDRE